MLVAWILYANDTDKSNNWDTVALGDEEMFAMVTKRQEDSLPMPDAIRDIYYENGAWILD